MTTYDQAWVEAEEAKREFMAENGHVPRGGGAFVLWCWSCCVGGRQRVAQSG